MSDQLFSDPELVALYDPMCVGRDDFVFYLPLLMPASSVLDVGCGTGELLIRARHAGHMGRLVGLDPAGGMLSVARKCRDIEWIEGDLATTQFSQSFDLIVMTGHAFQVFVSDAEIVAALASIHAALGANGRFVFETRNPLARAWEEWTPEKAGSVVSPTGETIGMFRTVDAVADGCVFFHHTFTSPGWAAPRVSHSTLRFLDAGQVAAFLSEAGFVIERQFGDWNGGPFTAASREIITLARRS